MNRVLAWSAAIVFAVCALVSVALIAGRVSRPHAWSDASTWGGRLPAPGSIVHIPENATVVLDVQPPPLRAIVVDGTLTIADRDVRLETGSIAVRGVLQAGSERQRFAHRATIVLDGASAEGGVLEVLRGGRVDLWGAQRLPWARLARTALPGSSELLLDATPDWSAGDAVAIAPSGFDALETEQRTVVAVDGARVRLDSALAYRHWGTVTDGVDERAEVGLLTHGITIESAPQARSRGLGGEVLVTAGGALHASGVAFWGLGKRGKLGKYPIHFHLAGDGRGSFVEASSIVHSNNRCIAVHGTDGVRVADNVAYDTIGHCYFLEDGIETANVFDGNLGMLTRAASQREAILESDLSPATYWITNPANVVRNNVAAGSLGTGFWYDLSPHPTGPSTNASVWPRQTPLSQFSGNVAHGNEMNGLFVDILRNPPGVTEAPNYSPPSVATFDRFTSYKNRRRGVWLRGTKLRLANATIADNSIGVTFAGADALLTDSLVVGETGNATGPPKPLEASFPIRGFEFYDGRVGVERTHFANFVSNAARRASALSELQFSPFFSDPTNFASELTFSNAQPVFFEKHVGAKDRLGADGYRGTVFKDVDGSVSGAAGSSIVLDTPFLADRDCTLRPQWNALICPAAFASLFIIGVDAGKQSPGPVRVATVDRPAFLTLYGNPQPGRDAIFQTSVRGGRAYSVTFANGFPRHVRVGLHHLPQGQTLTLAFPQASPLAVVRDRRNAGNVTFGRQNDALIVLLKTQHAGDADVLDICAAEPCG